MFSGCVNSLKSEAEPKQIILATDSPVAGEAQALAQPQQGFEAGYHTPCRREITQTSHFRHHLFKLEVITLDHLLQVLGDAMSDLGVRMPPATPSLIAAG